MHKKSGVIPVLLVLAAPAIAAAQQRVELPARDRLLTDQPARVWAVGTDEGESWEMFANVGSLAFDAHDNLYVLDQGNSRILVFDRTGKFVRQFGKQGGGPGEFQFPQAITIATDGAIVVFDGGRRGYSVFEPDGTFRGIVPSPEGVGFPRGNEIAAYPDGGIVVRSMPPMNLKDGPPTDSSASPVYVQSLDEKNPTMTRLHDFMMPPPRVITPPGSVGGRQMRMIAFSRPTFGADPSWGVLPDGRIAISEGDDYAIHLSGPDNARAAILTRPIQGHKVTKRDQEAAKEQRRSELRKGGGDGIRIVTTGGNGGGGVSFGGAGSGQPLTDAQIQAQLDRMEFADMIPAITHITTDPTGRIWVLRRPAKVGDEAPFDLLRADGTYIGTVEKQSVPRAISRTGLAAWIEKNDLDIEQVVVRRLPDSWK
jgi:6-bladed beta-propeller